MNNTLFYLSESGLLTNIKKLEMDVAANAFNKKFDGKEMLGFLIKYCRGNPRRLSEKIVFDLVSLTGKAGIYIDDSIDVDMFVLDNLDVIWKAAHVDNAMAARLYIDNTMRSYTKLLESRRGQPVVLLTQEDHPPTLNNASSYEEFGVTFSGYFSDDIRSEKRIFKKIKQECQNYVESIETLKPANV